MVVLGSVDGVQTEITGEGGACSTLDEDEAVIRNVVEDWFEPPSLTGRRKENQSHVLKIITAAQGVFDPKNKKSRG